MASLGDVKWKFRIRPTLDEALSMYFRDILVETVSFLFKLVFLPINECIKNDSRMYKPTRVKKMIINLL